MDPMHRQLLVVECSGHDIPEAKVIIVVSYLDVSWHAAWESSIITSSYHNSCCLLKAGESR